MQRSKLTEREKRNALALHGQGYNHREIARRLQRSPASISRVLHDRKLTGVQAQLLPDDAIEAVQREIDWDAWERDDGQDEPEALTDPQ